MDLSKLKTTDYLVGGGAIVFLLSMFFPWYKAEVSGGGFSASVSVNGFHYTLFGYLPLLLIIGVFVLLVLPSLAEGVSIPEQVGPLPKKQAALIGAGIAAVLVLLRLILKDDGGAEVFGVEVKRGLGLFLALLSSIAVLVGTLMKAQGTEDIKSVKMPNQNDFGGGGGPAGPPQQF